MLERFSKYLLVIISIILITTGCSNKLNIISNKDDLNNKLFLRRFDFYPKNELENELVNIGTSALPQLVDELQVVRGIKRGVVAMTLIRIGDASVKYLKKAAENNKEFEWVAQYLIREIEGSVAA